MVLSTSAATVLSPVLEQWKRGGRSLDRTVGATVTVGIAYTIFRLIRKYIRKIRLSEKSYFLEVFIRGFRHFLEISPDSQSKISPEEEVVHCGACHCRSVLFEVSTLATKGAFNVVIKNIDGFSPSFKLQLV